MTNVSYSREYNLYRQKIAGEAHHNTALQIELDKIVERVRQMKRSSIRMDNRPLYRAGG